MFYKQSANILITLETQYLKINNQIDQYLL